MDLEARKIWSDGRKSKNSGSSNFVRKSTNSEPSSDLTETSPAIPVASPLLPHPSGTSNTDFLPRPLQNSTPSHSILSAPGHMSDPLDSTSQTESPSSRPCTPPTIPNPRPHLSFGLFGQDMLAAKLAPSLLHAQPSDSSLRSPKACRAEPTPARPASHISKLHQRRDEESVLM